MKKRELASVDPALGFVQEEVGYGITKGKRTRFSGPMNAEGLSLLKETLERASNCPLVALEDELRGFLREAGIPDDPTDGGKHPFQSHVTEELKEAERISGPWYAAAILDLLAEIRRLHGYARDEGDKRLLYDAVLSAFQAGGLYKEAAMKFEWEEAALVGDRCLRAARGPRAPRMYVPLASYLKERTRKNGGLTAAKLWDELRKYDDDAPLKIKGGELVFIRGGIKIFSAPHGDRTFSLKKFREYFRACKNTPSRAK